MGNAFDAQGHDVHIFASIPSYGDQQNAPRREMLGPLSVTRCWVLKENRNNPALRLVNVVLYCFGLFITTLRLRPDIVTASTFPPVIASWTASLAAKIVGARFIYHCQDIHPEVSYYSGGRLGRGVSFKVLRWLDNQTLRRASDIVVLSQDMVQTLMQRDLGPLPVRIINNFCLDTFDTDVAPPVSCIKPAGTRRVIFAGNMGRFQNLTVLSEGVALALDTYPDLELVFMGAGAAKQALQARWADHPRVKFFAFLPYTEAKAIIAQADVGLVSLQADIYRVAYPSKVLTYAALGLPMLALVEPQSALAHDIERQSWGQIPADSTPQAIAATLIQMLDADTQKQPRDLSIQSVLPHWLDLIGPTT